MMRFLPYFVAGIALTTVVCLYLAANVRDQDKERPPAYFGKVMADMAANEKEKERETNLILDETTPPQPQPWPNTTEGVYVTLFTTMRNPTATQRAALKSFSLLQPRPEIIVFADEGDNATAKLAQEFGCRVLFIDDWNKQWNKPYIDTIIKRARQEASADYLLLVNGDIVLTQDVLDALRHTIDSIGDCNKTESDVLAPFFKERSEVDYIGGMERRPDMVEKCSPPHAPLPAFFLSGRRWSYTPARNFSDEEWEQFIGSPGWTEQLRELVKQTGKLGAGTEMDFFAFPRYMNMPMPRYLVGLPRWDTWLLDYSVKHKIPVVDVSHVVFAMHHNHTSTWSFKEPNSQAMYRLYPKTKYVDISKSNWILRPCKSEECTPLLMPRPKKSRKVQPSPSPAAVIEAQSALEPEPIMTMQKEEHAWRFWISTLGLLPVVVGVLWWRLARRLGYPARCGSWPK